MPVFISHASEDKPRLLPLIQALRLHGLPIFLDNPQDLHLSVHETHALGLQQLIANEHWEKSLEEWLGKSVVLICLSKGFASLSTRDVLEREVRFALETERAVVCALDPIDADTFASHDTLRSLAPVQIVKLDHAALADALRLGGRLMTEHPMWLRVGNLVDALNQTTTKRIAAGDSALPRTSTTRTPVETMLDQIAQSTARGLPTSSPWHHEANPSDAQLIFLPSGQYTIGTRTITLAQPLYITDRPLPCSVDQSPDDVRAILASVGASLPSESEWEAALFANALLSEFDDGQTNALGLYGTEAGALELVNDYYLPTRTKMNDGATAPGFSNRATFKSTIHGAEFRTAKQSHFSNYDLGFRVVFHI